MNHWISFKNKIKFKKDNLLLIIGQLAFALSILLFQFAPHKSYFLFLTGFSCGLGIAFNISSLLRRRRIKNNISTSLRF